MNIVASFIPNFQTAISVKPSESAFHNPAIHAQSAAVFGSAFRQHRTNAYVTQSVAMRLRIVSPVAIKRIKAIARTALPACDSWNRIDHRQQLRNIMAIRTGQLDDNGQALGVGEDMMLRPQFPSIRWIRARFRPPKTARTEAESTTAREKSILSACRSLLSSTWWILSQIPCFFQRSRRRQHVIPLPHPISFGRYSQGIPVRNTKRIPVNAFRLLTGGRPPLGRAGGLGNNGSMISHNSSERSGLAMTLSSLTIHQIVFLLLSIHRLVRYQKLRFC